MAHASKRLLALMDDKERASEMKKSHKSMKLGYGGRAAKLNDKLASKGMPKKERGAIIGMIARKKGAAPGQKNYHGK